MRSLLEMDKNTQFGGGQAENGTIKNSPLIDIIT
jgi:hypothetical protein